MRAVQIAARIGLGVAACLARCSCSIPRAAAGDLRPHGSDRRRPGDAAAALSERLRLLHHRRADLHRRAAGHRRHAQPAVHHAGVTGGGADGAVLRRCRRWAGSTRPASGPPSCSGISPAACCRSGGSNRASGRHIGVVGVRRPRLPAATALGDRAPLAGLTRLTPGFGARDCTNSRVRRLLTHEDGPLAIAAISRTRAAARGAWAMRAGGLGIGGLLLLLVLSWATGIDFLSLVVGGGGGSAPSANVGRAPPARSTSPAEEKARRHGRRGHGRRAGHLAAAARRTVPATTKAVLFRDAIKSALRLRAVGDRAVLLSGRSQGLSGSRVLQRARRRFGAPGDFAQAYVLAHELGHHVQTLTGIERQVRRAPVGATRPAERAVGAAGAAGRLLRRRLGPSRQQGRRGRVQLEPGDVEEASTPPPRSATTASSGCRPAASPRIASRTARREQRVDLVPARPGERRPEGVQHVPMSSAVTCWCAGFSTVGVGRAAQSRTAVSSRRRDAQLRAESARRGQTRADCTIAAHGSSAHRAVHSAPRRAGARSPARRATSTTSRCPGCCTAPRSAAPCRAAASAASTSIRRSPGTSSPSSPPPTSPARTASR